MRATGTNGADPLSDCSVRGTDQHDGLKDMLAELQKDRDKREGHAQERKELRVAYINRIYEAEKRQVHDEFEVRLHARFLLRGHAISR